MNAVVTTTERQPKKTIDIDELRSAIRYSRLNFPSNHERLAS